LNIWYLLVERQVVLPTKRLAVAVVVRVDTEVRLSVNQVEETQQPNPQ
jgi:hypothetical protein